MVKMLLLEASCCVYQLNLSLQVNHIRKVQQEVRFVFQQVLIQAVHKPEKQKQKIAGRRNFGKTAQVI